MNKFFKTFRNPLISAIVTFVIALLSVSGILYQRNTIQLQQRHDEIDNAANTLREKIETIFSEVHAAANAISIFTTEKRPNEGFDSLAKNIFYFIQSIDDLRLVEGEIITHSYSKDGQVPVNIIGHNIFSDSLLNKEVAITLKYKDLYFAGPLNLLQGGKGFVGRLPIYHGDKYYGFGVVTIKMATFLNAIGLNENRDDKFIYQLSKVNVNTGIEEFFLPYGKKFNNKETVVINLPNANFNIYTTLPNINFFYTYWVIILFALLISFSVAYFAWFVANKPKRMQMTIDESMKMIRLGEAKYKSLFKHAFESIFILNTRGNIVEVNDSFSNLIGYSQQELLKMTIEDLILEQDVKNIPLNDQLVKQDDSIIRNRKLKTKDDKIVELQISKTVMGDSRILCIGRDVTEFNEIQKQIQLSESTLKSAFEYSSVSMTMVSLNGNYSRTNLAFRNMIGYSEEELLSMNFKDITYVDDKKGDDIFLDDVINGLVNGINRTKRYVTKNGAIIWIDIHSSAIKATDGTPIFILSQIIDVTLKRIADNEILKLNRLYHFISTANEYLLRADDKKMLFEESCRIAVELGGVSMAWAGVIDENNQVDAFASYGNNEGFLENTQMSTLDDLAISNGPTGLAVRTKTYSFNNDIENDPAMAPWRKEALQRGYKGSISYPIIINKKVKATFTIYVSEVNYFNETEIKLLKELVDNISFTLEKIEIKEKQQISELDLIESEEKFRILVEQVMIGVYILQDEKFVYVNPGFEEISGYSYNELIGRMSFDDLIHEDDIGIISNYNRVVASKQKKFQHVLRAIHATGELRHIEIVVAGITYNNKAAFIGSIIDITSRVEEDKRINQAIIDAQEKERLQIGMELHDNVKQILGAAILQLGVVEKRLDDKNEVLKVIKTLYSYNSEAINELRRLSHQLAPTLESSESLAEKIEALVTNMKLNDSLQFDIIVDEIAMVVNHKLQLTFYRIIQEQLNNIIKHANAKKVVISIKVIGQNFVLTLSDDGKGFDSSRKKIGIGLRNIKRRAELLGGKKIITSAPGEGCTIVVEIPGAIDDDL